MTEIISENENPPSIVSDNDVLARGGSTSLLGLTLSKILTFLTEIILARFLGVTNYGLLSLGRTIIQTPNFAADIGLRNGIVKYGAMYWIREQKDYQKGILLGSIKVTVAVSLFLTLTIFTSASWLAQWFDEPRVEGILKVLSLMLLPSAVSMVIASYARAQLKFGMDVFLRILARQALIFLMSLIVIGWLKGDALSTAYILLAAAVINAALAIIVVFRNFYPSLRYSKTEYDLRKWIRFSVPIFLVDVTYLMLKNTGRILLGYFGQVEAVGIFTVVSTLGENLIFFLIAFNPILAPIIVAYHSTGNRKELTRNYKTVGRWQLILTLPFAIVMIAYPREVMSLFGADFQASGLVLIIVILAQCAYVATGPSGIVLQMTGHHDLELANGFIAFLINLVLGLILIPQYGLIGASISTALSLALLQVFRLIEVYYFLRFFPFDMAFLKGIVAGLVSYIFGISLKQLFVIQSTLSTLIIGAGAILLVFTATLLILKLEKSDIELINGIIHKLNVKLKM